MALRAYAVESTMALCSNRMYYAAAMPDASRLVHLRDGVCCLHACSTCWEIPFGERMQEAILMLNAACSYIILSSESLTCCICGSVTEEHLMVRV